MWQSIKRLCQVMKDKNTNIPFLKILADTIDKGNNKLGHVLRPERKPN